ncbi:uncharacterized protein LOC130404808 [Gadus chalcogrammus]|uniref:uncharacterized protein LOC130404808 n=1 Tax=Gadus chalcogrammus TaxID=1042646 RepID=UPI0024C4B6B7|nr:uncharacterized protein LOC130404808 [Gadus chalcogrammus]
MLFNSTKETTGRSSCMFLELAFGPWGSFTQEAGHLDRCIPNRVGMHLEGRSVRGIWQPPWTSEHINVLKLKAIHLALQRILPAIQHNVLVRSDKTSAVYHVNHQGGTKSQRCLQVAEELLTWAWPRLASVRAVHIPGVANSAADMLSRTGPLPGEWRLHKDVVKQIWIRYEVAQVDLFASAETTHCPEWYSLRGQFGPGCSITRVADRLVVRFSSDPPHLSGSAEDQGGPTHSPAGCSTLASENLVFRSAPATAGSAMAVAEQGRPAGTSRWADMASEPGRPAPLGLASTEPVTERLDAYVRETINNARAPSTRASYALSPWWASS